MAEKMVDIGEVFYTAGMGEAFFTFYADPDDVEAFRSALTRGALMQITIDGATHLIPANMIRRFYFSKGWPDDRRYKHADITFWTE